MRKWLNRNCGLRHEKIQKIYFLVCVRNLKLTFEVLINAKSVINDKI